MRPQVNWVLERMSRSALWQHSQRGSRRRKWPDTRNVPRQAGLLPRLGNMLGKRCRRAPLPRLATEWHPRRQWCVVRRVCTSSHHNPPAPPHPGNISLFTHLYMFIDAHVQTELYRASKEEPSQKRHKITKNGYNLGRDWFVKRALAGSHWKRHQIWWRAEVEWRTDLLESGNKGALALCSSPVSFFVDRTGH